MKTMRAVRPASGGPGVSLQTVPRPQAGPDEVLVEVGASAIDPIPVAAFDEGRTLGRDFAGVVVSGGEWAGKAVWGSAHDFGVDRDGTHADFVSLPASWLSEKPIVLGMGPAAAAGAPFLAAWAALEAARLQAGDTVLIPGAAAPSARAAAMLARARKVKVICADTVSPAPSSDAYVDLRATELTAEVLALTDGQGVDAVVDVVGGPLFASALDALGRDGRYVLTSAPPDAFAGIDLGRFHRHRQQLVAVDPARMSGIEAAEILDQLRALFDASLLAPPPARTWPLEDARAAFAAASRSGGWPRQVLTPH